jgi:UDP-3-O-[3-hydroxymyristoyl] glucosamine N-acyltransferase
MRPVQIISGELAALVGGELIGDAALPIRRIATLAQADRASVAFLANARYRSQLDASMAGCVIVAAAERERAATRPSAIVCADPYAAYAALTRWWAARARPAVEPGIHATAQIDPSAQIADSAAIGAFVVIGPGAVIGDDAFIGPHCSLGDEAGIGAGSRLAARVTLGHGCRIGARAIVHGGVVIGADGFGFAPVQGRWEKIEQLGAVVIGDDVEIGANTCIDRGAIEDTVVEDGVKIDNLVQVGHNVRIGAHSALAGCVGIAGSARIGRHCSFGGGAIVLGHIELADHVHVSAATLITRSIRESGLYSGAYPFEDNASWERNAATLRQLHAMRGRLRALEAKTT